MRAALRRRPMGEDHADHEAAPRQDPHDDTRYENVAPAKPARRLAVALCLAASLLTAVPLLAAPALARPAATTDAQPAARSFEPLSALWNGIVQLLLGPGGGRGDAGRGAAPADASGSATPVAAVHAADSNDVGPALDPNGAK